MILIKRSKTDTAKAFEMASERAQRCFEELCLQKTERLASRGKKSPWRRFVNPGYVIDFPALDIQILAEQERVVGYDKIAKACRQSVGDVYIDIDTWAEVVEI